MGDANGAGEDNRNVARMAALLAGLPIEVAGQTVNRLCGSGLQAVVSAGPRHPLRRGRPVHRRRSREHVAGSVGDAEAGGRLSAPRARGRPTPPSAGGSPTPACPSAGRSASARRPRSWPTSTASAARSRTPSRSRASGARAAALEERPLRDEIVPSTRPRPQGRPGVVEVDEHPRPEVTAEKLARLRPAFREGGTVTAGNASGINDGAAAVLVGSREAARELGLQPLRADRRVGRRRRRSRPHGHRADPRRSARRWSGPSSTSATSTWSS